MSKAEKERLKKEEAERKAVEEEAAKVQAMEDAKKAKKEEAALSAERIKHENEERRRRRDDMSRLQDMLDKNRNALQCLNNNRRVQAKWARYMRCNGSPDPTNQGEINTYINMRLEDNSRNDAVSVLKDILLDLSLIDELHYLLNDTPVEELPESERSLCQETISEIEKLMGSKLDHATLQILCGATSLANPETNNLQHVVSNDFISLCVWGNLTKNPRIRHYEFPEVKVTFDIPKVLSLSDCAVRVLITKFDHYSPTSKASIPRRKKKEEALPEITEEEEKKDEEGEEGKEGEEAKEGEEKEDGVEEMEKEETEIDLEAALRGDDGAEEEVKEEVEEEEAYEIDFEDPATPEPAEWEDFDEEDDIMDLRANEVLGGIFHINLLHMPPQPKTAGSWTITQMVEPPEIAKMEYVPDPPAPIEEKNGEKGKDNKDKDSKKDEKPPITISMTLPKDVLFLEEPQVGQWDYKKKFWSSKEISDVSFNEDARSLSFKMNSFGTLCLLQDAHINMPFQSWEIRPHKLNHAVFSIIAAIVEVQIEIKDALCCLTQPRDKPELESIRNKWVTPSELITMMRGAGVNIFPNEDSSKYVSIQNKHPLIEERMYEQMAMSSSAMAYSWSKWNGETEREQIVFQAAESLEDEPLLEEDWWIMLGTKRRVTKLKMTEFDDTFSDVPEGDLEYKSNIYHLMKEITSETAQERVNDTDYQFADCVHQLLKATKVLTYA